MINPPLLCYISGTWLSFERFLDKANVVWWCSAVFKCKSSWVVQGKAGMNIVKELTAKGIEVLSQICIEEGQLPLVVVQCHTNSQGMAGYSDVWCPAIVQKLVLVPIGKRMKNDNRRIQRLSHACLQWCLVLCYALQWLMKTWQMPCPSQELPWFVLKKGVAIATEIRNAMGISQLHFFACSKAKCTKASAEEICSLL